MCVNKFKEIEEKGIVGLEREDEYCLTRKDETCYIKIRRERKNELKI